MTDEERTRLQDMGWTSSEIEDLEEEAAAKLSSSSLPYEQEWDEARKELERHQELPHVVKVIYGVGLTIVMALVAIGFLIVVLNLWQCGRTQ